LELHGNYSPWLVALSYLIATLASYISLRLASQTAADDPVTSGEVQGVLPAALALGLGIWSMHFTGMAAFRIDGMTIGYRWDVTLLSLVVAVCFTAIGFASMSLLGDWREAVLVAAIPMGAGILAMHFLGMMAMTGDMHIRYRADLVLASALIALTASAAALYLSTRNHGRTSRVTAALAMGVAICGMHYTGMSAAKFIDEKSLPKGESPAPSF